MLYVEVEEDMGLGVIVSYSSRGFSLDIDVSLLIVPHFIGRHNTWIRYETT